MFSVTVEESRCTAGDIGFFAFIVLYFGPVQTCKPLLCLPIKHRNKTGNVLKSETVLALSCVHNNQRTLVNLVSIVAKVTIGTFATLVTKVTRKGRAMAEAASRRPLTAEARVRSRVGPCGICGGQSGTGTGFLRVLRFFPVIFIPPVLY